MNSPQSSVDQYPYGVVVVCTKDRPDEIKMSCAAADKASPNIPILVIDASTTDATRDVCEIFMRQNAPSLTLLYRRASQPGLALQRNEAIGICLELGVQVVHFIDDDTEVLDGYFDAIEHRFRTDPAVMGIGGVILNQLTVNYVAIKSFFLLGSSRRGSVLRSGRNILGQYPGTLDTDHVEWLNGCSMSFRITVFDEAMFDDGLRGYSLGEDYDFSFRVGRKHKLVVEPAAVCIHHLTPTMRGSARTHARQATEATHRWVNAHRALGMSPIAFWWSTFGDFLLHIGYGIIYVKRESLQAAVGVVDGVIAIICGRATHP
jgi:cellulose synthase/poly-beta-1,6-N-acetylglucosamine synthase-like glycosyltransferase